MRINTNIAALNSYNQLNNTQNNLSKSLERLSSGKRINGAADDAAGLAISEKMSGQVRGLGQAQRNAQDAISMNQTAEGALKESHAILQRMRELAVQSANDTNTEDDRAEIQEEVDQLAAELTRIGNTTEFNTQKLLDGTLENTFQIGSNEAQNMELEVNDMRADALGVASAEGVNIEGVSTTTTAGTQGAVEADTEYDVVELDEAVDIDDSAGTPNTVEDIQYGLEDSDGNIVSVSTDGKEYWALDSATSEEELSSATIADTDTSSNDAATFDDPVISGTVTSDGSGTDFSDATATVDFEDAELKSGTFTVVDDNHHSIDTDDYGLTDSNGDLVAVSTDGDDWDTVEGDNLFTVSGANTLDTAGDTIEISGDGGVDVSSQSAADSAITTIDDAISKVSSERSKLGAVQNRLEHTINNLNTAEENLTAAESRISDVDMAEEMMSFTKNQILSQAGTAMMAQANQLPQGVLQLLG